MGDSMTDVSIVITAINVILTTVLVVITGYYAHLTNKISMSTERNANIAIANNMANIELTLLKDYARDDVLEAMKDLRDFQIEGNYNNKKKSRQKMNSDFIVTKVSNPRKFDRLDAHRRRISHHFQIIYKLKKKEAIDSETFMDLVEKEQAKFYLEIIEPLEGGMNNPNYHQDSFDLIGGLYSGLREDYPDMKNWDLT